MAGAQASIVYSGALNTQVTPIYLPMAADGIEQQTTVNMISGPSVRFNVYRSKGSYSLLLDSFSTTFDPVSTGSSLQLFSGAGGDFIDGNDIYSLASSIQSTTISAGTTSYFGFRFTPGKSTQRLFGWVEFTYGPGTSWFMNSYAYQDSGAGILTGDTGVVAAANGVPEPGTVPLIAAAGLAAAFFRRHRHGYRQPG